ncbi:transposase [Methylocystis sp. H62]|nr:transposase [Methylocystis sp. H62]
MNDDALEAALYGNRRSKRGHRRVEEPDWANVHRELKRKHVTLTILWDEYIAENPGGYRYSRSCELYRAFARTLSVTMRQTHAAGERLFVDYAGDGVPVVVDRLTGEVRMGQIFVAVLGASSLTFARASWTQTLPDWIDAHVGAPLHPQTQNKIERWHQAREPHPARKLLSAGRPECEDQRLRRSLQSSSLSRELEQSRARKRRIKRITIENRWLQHQMTAAETQSSGEPHPPLNCSPACLKSFDDGQLQVAERTFPYSYVILHSQLWGF